MTANVEGRSDQGSTGNEMSATLDDYLVLSPHAGDDHDDLCQLGQLAMNRHDLDSKCFHGEGSVRDFCVGEYFELEGHPEIDAHASGEREFVITAMQIFVTNNLSNTLTERAVRLFSRSRWLQHMTEELSAKCVQVEFIAVRRGTPIVPAFDARIDLPNVPMQSAIVVGPDGEEVYCDELGRVKIRFRATRPDDHGHAHGAGSADHDGDSAWVRVVSNWAGASRGHHQCGSLALPRIGTEVLITFLGGDPDRPVIVGQLYNEHAGPPSFGADVELPPNRYVSGVRSHEIRGSGANQLRFDDTPGELSAQLASSTEDSQLNLGYLTRPRVTGSGSRRGVGAELRSTAITAIRGAGGLLLSGWKHSRTDAAHSECDEFKGLIANSAEIVHRLGQVAEARGAELGLDDGLSDLSAKYESWGSRYEPNASTNGEISISSPSVIAMATAGTIANYSMKSSYYLSSQCVQIYAGSTASISSQQHISIFSYEGDLTAISGKGKFILQSQSGTGEILSAKDLRIASTDGKLIACAKEIELVGADGSYIRIGDGITLGSNGTVKIHASKFIFDNPDTEDLAGHVESYEDPSSEEKREVEIEFVDADGNSPKNDEVALTFMTGQHEITQSIFNGRGVLSSLPQGAFKLVQKSRLG